MLNISKQRVNVPAIENEVNSLHTLHSPKTARIVYRWILGIVIVLILVMFLPWQQNINGKGYVTALTPKDRPQNIQNAVAGQIQHWYVREGDYVKKGDTLLTISEIKDDYFDPQVLVRTQEQIEAKQAAINAYNAKIQATDSQISSLRQGLQLSLEKTRNKLLQARLKVKSDSADFIAINRGFDITKERLERGEAMYKDGTISLVDLESRRVKFQEDQAKVTSQSQKLAISRNELINARIELSSVQVDYQKDIAKSFSDRSSALSSLADGESELSKLKNKYENIRIRREQYVVHAPQDGYIIKTLKAGIGETIKEGESIVTLQPDKPDLAVELYIKAMDLSLIKPGRHVRLEFDGWPALQFSGWPGTSVGTFGGTVAIVDRVNSKNGEYRLLIKSDHEGNENDKWPDQLRIGSGVNGFVMLKDVPIWWEVWRQLNGFPPDYLSDILPAEEKEKK
ncbi:multidrug resistance efflux pump [Runella defluvii]|uniref:Multidrug resistance efflux pump n=1 Tax=Runella defluvii TaxID=370973 RepID=A0A7W5ZIW9_9BACT|nr:HlyD family efflux transporter periplasmic adaptor subunit [Runella defluvii]MBB3836757.1 multidrug resistance efflux pump [Runella defluvii]HAK76246.1 biotin attachment protein [Runella sp.]HAO50021.1 biotin attachment protein [Runella sp.]